MVGPQKLVGDERKEEGKEGMGEGGTRENSSDKDRTESRNVEIVCVGSEGK